MITSNKDFEGLRTNNKPETYYGLSTDEKPITAVNGSCFIEMDTSIMYFFDEETTEWSIWSSSGGGGGSSSLSGLTDVDISNPTDGQTMVYNATSGKWENGESAGGGVLVVRGTLSDDTLTLDKTWQEIYDADAVSIVWVEDVDNKTYMTCQQVAYQPPLGGGSAVYSVFTSSGGDVWIFETNSASGYPSCTFE